MTDRSPSESPALLLHRLTSYDPGREWTDPVADPRIVQDLQVNDPQRRPRFYKDYPADLPRVALDRDLPTLPDVVPVLAGAVTPAAREPDLATVSPLLYLSAGITRVARRGELMHPFRAAGSAGARFPLEVYLAVPTGGSLPAGVHWYDPQEHELVRVGPPPTDEAGGTAPSLIVTGVPWRTGWRYRERGWRHLYWDAGTLLSQVLAVADAQGLGAELYATFPDTAVGELVGADGDQEFPLAVVALGGPPALTPGGAASGGRLDDDAAVFPAVTAAQRAGDTDHLGSAIARGPAIDVPRDDSRGVEARPLDRALLARSSYRRLQRQGRLPRAALEAATIAMRGVDVAHFVAVNAVDGVDPGMYAWPDLDRPLRRGDLRGELYGVALDQGLPRDAAYVVISAVDAASLDDRGYREAQLLAGLVEGRLHILAPAWGAGANGMTFSDSELPALLGDTGYREVVGLLWTCVGVPEYAPKAGGAPAAPVTIRTVEPRMDDGA